MKLNSPLKTFWECDRSQSWTNWRTGSSWGKSWAWQAKPRDKITEVSSAINVLHYLNQTLSGLAALKTFWECHRSWNGTIWSSCWTSWGCRCGCDRNPWEKFIQKEQKLKENLVILYIISCYWMPLGFQKMSFFEK